MYRGTHILTDTFPAGWASALVLIFRRVAVSVLFVAVS
jgi:hypothetical protein